MSTTVETSGPCRPVFAPASMVPVTETDAIPTCARCGNPCDGLAAIYVPGEGEKFYCHPDMGIKPDCFALTMIETWGSNGDE